MRRLKIIISALLIFLITSGGYAQNEDSLVINYSFINSIPQNANVYLNDSLLGETPVRFFYSILDSTKGSSINIKLEGYYDYLISVDKEKMPINRTVLLVAKTGDLTALEKRQVLANTETYFKTPRKVFPVILSAVITGGSGFLSYYFKQLSNDKYDEYQNTGDASLLDKKRKYDIISGISLAVFQIGLAGLVYFLIIE